MMPRHRRMVLVVGILAGVSLAGGLALSAFRQNVTFYFVPTQVAQGRVHPGEDFRLGGMVTKGSVHRAPGSMQVSFQVTDFKHTIPVVYSGVLPDLFREGAGVIVHGKMLPDGTFVADQVLAKHDQYYKPPGIHPMNTGYGQSRDAALATPAVGAGNGIVAEQTAGKP